MIKIGITERGDAGLDFGWVTKMDEVVAAILIIKSVNDGFIKHVLPFKEKVIVHATVTGMGGTVIEPMVRKPDWAYVQVQKLVGAGFPVQQVVLRVDPIVPTPKGLQTAQKVLEMFKDTGIRRVRVSFCDMYPHVKERFRQHGIPVPYEFAPTAEMVQNAIALFNKYSDIYEFEACGEYVPFRVGCISHKDLEILGIDLDLSGSSNQRKACLCPSNKYELLERKHPCPHGCLYCYWKEVK